MIKVLTAHQVADDNMDAVMAIVETMRRAATDQPGYVLIDVLEPQRKSNEVLVISTWRSIEDWNHWFDHPVRAALQKAMDNHLAGKTAHTIYRDQ